MKREPFDIRRASPNHPRSYCKRSQKESQETLFSVSAPLSGVLIRAAVLVLGVILGRKKF